jgi:hypothetical protein
MKQMWKRPGSLLLFLLPAAVGLLTFAEEEARGEAKRYVGSAVCGDCHDLEHERFVEHAKKARSYESVAVMRSGLTDEEYRNCLECHATGYGQPGGFVSMEATPHLKDAGCEVCHGPGSRHVETSDRADIRSDLSLETCRRCHNEERVRSFDFKPLLFGGAH